MAIFEIVYSLYDKALPRESISGFELGYIFFRCSEDAGRCNDGSCDDLNNQPSMIFLTISELLSGLAEYEEKKQGFLEVTGVDSSLSFCFERVNKFTKIRLNGSCFATVETGEILKEAYGSSVSFCKAYYPYLLSSVRNDLDYAFHKIKSCLL